MKREQWVKAAREQWQQDGEIEIDDNAQVSIAGPDGDDGAYVAAWVWVSKE